MKNYSMYLLLLVFVMLLSRPVYAETLHGKVVSVTDGDTLTILTPEERKVKIRLVGIDTPEKKQAYGVRAKNFTASLVAEKNITVEPKATDRHGRTVGIVFVNGDNVNEQIIIAGYGWVYRKYCQYDFCGTWLREESQARKARKGLWSDPQPVPPWEWRQQQ